MRLLCAIQALTLVTLAHASDQVGTITQLEGNVKLFAHPTKSLDSENPNEADANGPHALFEGEYFQVRDAKVGDRVDHGSILRTAPGSKARVVFDNGDQFNVGPGTAYRAFWDKDKATARTKIDLMYGSLRGVVAHGGPRSHLLVRTKSAAMGVRGTDFFIASGLSKENGIASEETQVSIMRGQVEVTPKFRSKTVAQVIQVKAGYSAEVVEAVKLPMEARKSGPAPHAELRKTTQEDLSEIQKSSEMSANRIDSPEAIRGLEKKAVQTTMEDVKHANPKLYASLLNRTFKSPDEINHLSTEELRPMAPKATPKQPALQTPAHEGLPPPPDELSEPEVFEKTP